MYKTRLGGRVDGAKAHLGYVETDPSGRYGRVSSMVFSDSSLQLIIIWILQAGINMKLHLYSFLRKNCTDLTCKDIGANAKHSELISSNPILIFLN